MEEDDLMNFIDQQFGEAGNVQNMPVQEISDHSHSSQANLTAPKKSGHQPDTFAQSTNLEEHAPAPASSHPEAAHCGKGSMSAYTYLEQK